MWHTYKLDTFASKPDDIAELTLLSLKPQSNQFIFSVIENMIKPNGAKHDNEATAIIPILF